MSLSVLFDTIIINANEAKTLFSQGIENDAFNKLEEIVKTIQILKDFKDKYSLWQYPASSNTIDTLEQISPERKKRKRNSIEKYIGPANSVSVNQPQTQSQSSQPISLLSEYPLSYSPNNFENELVDRLDEIFFGFLASICSNLDACDKAGERIHQTMIAKKLNKVTETVDFKQFKFRIRSFTNAFREELQRNGITEDVISEKKARHYLWQHKYISRFNEDGKKAKSKGNHVWIIEAKKTADGGWIFKEFERKIAGPEPSTKAIVGKKYTYQPRIYDPQIRSPKVVFHSPWLPSWLSWENNVLSGIPDETAEDCEITVIASYYHGDSSYKLEKSFYLRVSKWQEDETPLDGGLSATIDPVALNASLQFSDNSSTETETSALLGQYTPTTFNPTSFTTSTTFTPTIFNTPTTTFSQTTFATPTPLTPTNLSTVSTDTLTELTVSSGLFSPHFQVTTDSPEIPSQNEFYQTSQPLNSMLWSTTAF
ncbi:hypothetical protein BCR36DRAFT_317480 [Piromyces finnis]|uniref:Uncharacterized protein n=1 Tax=Piromyces finnis TaxID=1754191 RepID=A0A1Y1VLK5_9FUNG|nr:hypothetical protein BCR36DRAFT_317480 [Piromyces finnis]|eukprot:ORX59341.1 hypothetical protein BCR36DRAFT_317480 [Piromyces finnis]